MPEASSLHRLILDCPGDLPVVRGDWERLSEVIGNLLSNAIKYSPKGGTVAVKGRLDGKHVIISIKDEGIGIPAELQAKIFDIFYRVDNTDRRLFGGAGLGLAVVREIVVAHGGRSLGREHGWAGEHFFRTTASRGHSSRRG